MSLTTLIAAAGHGLAEWWRRKQAYEELMALDDRTLADIGIHRSQIRSIVWREDVPERRQAAAPARKPLGGHGAFAAPR